MLQTELTEVTDRAKARQWIPYSAANPRQGQYVPWAGISYAALPDRLANSMSKRHKESLGTKPECIQVEVVRGLGSDVADPIVISFLPTRLLWHGLPRPTPPSKETALRRFIRNSKQNFGCRPKDS